MKEYEIVCTYLNGCAGAAHPVRTFEEAELQDPADYIRSRHSVDFEQFVREEREDGTVVYTCSGTVSYIYEFTQI